jgi:hypothetical protein
MPKISAARLRCLRPEHAGSRVKLDDTYGKPAHRRQRNKCPAKGDEPHVFTELLPREESWHGSCDQCERGIERRDGPKAPRNYQFVARGIAEALAAVGAGSSYVRASRVTRGRARRFRFHSETGEIRESDHGRSSRTGSSCSRRSSLSRATRPPFPNALPANWSVFLGSLPGEPRRIVCDAHSGMLRAIEERWPNAELHQCEWHLQHALDRLLTKERRGQPERGARGPAGSRRAGAHWSLWRPFVRAARAAENQSLDRWIAVNGPTIEAQFVRRRRPSQRPADMPLTTAALEQLTRPDLRRALSRPVRAQEPREAQPTADALAAPRQRR